MHVDSIDMLGNFKSMKTAILFALIACLNSLPAISAYPPVTVDMQLIQVFEHSFYVSGVAAVATDNEGFISNAGFMVTD